VRERRSLSWGIGRAATLLKTLLQYYGKSLEVLPGVAYPGFRDNRSTLNTKTDIKNGHSPQADSATALAEFALSECSRLPLYLLFLALQ